jgi:hypothetical protein
MKRADLTAEDQALLGTDFGEDLEKQAAEQAKTAGDMYQYGTGYAEQVADQFDKIAEEEKKEEAEEAKKEEEAKKDKEEMGEEGEKTAAVCAKFIHDGFVDGLKKLGSARHSDEMHYLRPYIQEKVAMAGYKAMAGKAKKALLGTKAKRDTAKGAAGAAVPAAALGYMAGKE